MIGNGRNAKYTPFQGFPFLMIASFYFIFNFAVAEELSQLKKKHQDHLFFQKIAVFRDAPEFLKIQLLKLVWPVQKGNVDFLLESI